MIQQESRSKCCGQFRAKEVLVIPVVWEEPRSVMLLLGDKVVELLSRAIIQQYEKRYRSKTVIVRTRKRSEENMVHTIRFEDNPASVIEHNA